MSEGRGVALAILGIVALIAVVGLILLFSGKMTGRVVTTEIYGGYGANKLYGGGDRSQEWAPRGSVEYPATYEGGYSSNPYEGSYVKGVPTTWEGQTVAVVGGSQATYREPSRFTTNCPTGLDYYGARQALSLSDDEFNNCIAADDNKGWCCATEGLNQYG